MTATPGPDDADPGTDPLVSPDLDPEAPLDAPAAPGAEEAPPDADHEVSLLPQDDEDDRPR